MSYVLSFCKFTSEPLLTYLSLGNLKVAKYQIQWRVWLIELVIDDEKTMSNILLL
jgi:hypothetical protein